MQTDVFLRDHYQGGRAEALPGGVGWRRWGGLLRGLLKKPPDHPSHRRWLLPVAPPSLAQSGLSGEWHAHARTHVRTPEPKQSERRPGASTSIPALHAHEFEA